MASFSDRCYHWLLRLLPADFRDEFGGDMEETFRAQRADAQSRGPSLARIWWATAADIFRMAPREHLSVLAQDARYALRMMRRNAGYTATAVLILGLGIGVNTAIFSVVNAVLWKPLPYAQGDRLVVLRQREPGLGIENLRFTPPEMNDYRGQNKTLSDLVEYHEMTFTLYGRDEAHRVKTGVVSAGFFDFFGVKPLLGRTFVPDDDRPGAQPVLVLSYEFWRQVERGNPEIVGKTYQMNDRPHVVIGVLPPIPQYPRDNDVYMTTTSCPFRSLPRSISSRTAFRLLNIFGRLKPQASVEWCRSDLSVIAGRLRQDHPDAYPAQTAFEATAAPLRDELTRRARPVLLVLLGAAGFVLLIACANVANLMLARMSRREQELNIRTAVGAGAGRLLRQLITESFLLALLAAGVGLAFAAGSVSLLAQFAGQMTPRAREIGLDGGVLAFAIGCAAATALVFGSVAALYSRRNIAAGLKEGGRSAERSRHWLRGGLIAAQVAFSFVLLIGAGLMVRSFLQLERVNPGFEPQHVLAVGIDINFSKFTQAGNRLLARRLLEKARSLPGVESAAVSSSFPLDQDITGGANRPRRFQVEGDAKPESEAPPITAVRLASPDYFRTLGIPLVAGRLFRDSDDEKSELVVIINRALALRRWGREDPIGRRIRLSGDTDWLRIVGVVGDVKEFRLDTDVPYQIYGALQQSPSPAALLLRTSGDPKSLERMARRAVREVDPQVAVTQMVTLEEARAESVASPRTLARLFGLFGVLALVIAIAGIASMLALWVRQRTREIGIRMAMGARPADIVTTVLRQGMVLVTWGLAAGVAGAWALSGFLANLLFQVRPTDPGTFVLVAGLFTATACLACLVPARRAARIDPQTALRCE